MKTAIAAICFASLLATSAAVQATVTITPSAGFTLTWDGNDGVGFNPASPAPAPANLANAPGATAFTSSDLGPQLGIPFHVATNINDGFYGNANSWIGGDGAAAPIYAAVRLASLSTITSIAFGRDNGNGAFDDSSPGTDCCGGQLDDRTLGLYTLQFTAVATPGAGTADTGDASTGWQSIGTLNYLGSEDIAPGGAFTAHMRHEYGLGAGVQATGFRLVVPGTGLGGGTAIDELEIYGSAVPEPAAAFGVLSGLLALAFRRRRE